jgi:hypothetical protein
LKRNVPPLRAAPLTFYFHPPVCQHGNGAGCRQD